jgi:hypothetical protein
MNLLRHRVHLVVNTVCPNDPVDGLDCLLGKSLCLEVLLLLLELTTRLRSTSTRVVADLRYNVFEIAALD